jgi:signal transduction histidine kinase
MLASSWAWVTICARRGRQTVSGTIGTIEDITEARRRRPPPRPITACSNTYHRTHRGVGRQRRLREKAAQDAVTAERTRLARDLHDADLFDHLIADVPDIWEDPERQRRLMKFAC